MAKIQGVLELAVECSCACVHVCVCVRVRVGVTLEARKCCPIFILVKTALNVHQNLIYTFSVFCYTYVINNLKIVICI